MGRTTPTTTELGRKIIEEWKPFRNALSKSERKEFDEMVNSARFFTSAMMMCVGEHPVPEQRILMSIIFRHYQQLYEMQKNLTHPTIDSYL
jgi:hypothetical protein